MPRLTTSYDASEPTSVKLSWDPAYDNSEPVDAYQILIRQSDDSYTELVAECDGSQDPVLTQLYCSVILSTLRDAPYSLQFDNLVVARIRAHNQFGWAEYSAENIEGAYV